MTPSLPMVTILVAANSEWQAVRAAFPDHLAQPSPYGEWFEVTHLPLPAVFFQCGVGKIAAAGGTQYAIDRWDPALVANLGTCGGFAGEVARGQLLVAERTLVYDLYEQMVDPGIMIERYTTRLDLSWAGRPLPEGVLPALLLSADRDLVASEVAGLKARYGAVAGDWESGAIAYVAARSGRPALILRGVSDLVGPDGGEAYADVEIFHSAARQIMPRLIASLPDWLERFRHGPCQG